MKRVRRTAGILLALCLVVACAAIPASAVSPYYTSARTCIEKGPYIYQNVSGQREYVLVL